LIDLAKRESSGPHDFTTLYLRIAFVAWSAALHFDGEQFQAMDSLYNTRVDRGLICSPLTFLIRRVGQPAAWIRLAKELRIASWRISRMSGNIRLIHPSMIVSA